ncbi:MAG: hypothetical protein WCC81_01505 [Pseudolabrys sp.]
MTKAVGKFRLLSLDRLDGRTIAARRAKELIESIEADLGGGDHISEGTRQLVRRAAVLGVYVESCETQWLAGEPVDLSDYLAAINAQRRVLATIGLQRGGPRHTLHMGIGVTGVDAARRAYEELLQRTAIA